MKSNNLLIIAATMLLLSACGTMKKAAPTPQGAGSTSTTTTENPTYDPFNAIVATLGDWQSLQTGGNISIKGSSNFSSSIQVRMVRDQAIHISLRPLLGIEVGRLVITGDSLIAVDKVHKRYIAEKVSVLTAGIPMTVSDVQDVFLGRPFVLGQGTASEQLKEFLNVSRQGNAIVLTSGKQFKGYGYAFTFEPSKRITSLDIVPTGATVAAYQVKYSDVKGTEAGNIAHGIDVDATVEKKKLSFSLDYKSIDWNRSVKIDRSIPSGYKRMSASDLFSLFSN